MPRIAPCAYPAATASHLEQSGIAPLLADAITQDKKLLMVAGYNVYGATVHAVHGSPVNEYKGTASLQFIIRHRE